MNKHDYVVRYIKTKNKVRKIITYSNDVARDNHVFICNKINKCFEPSKFSKGYVSGESIYTNAKAHMYNDYFIKMDIKDFFNSINHRVLRKKLYKEINTIASPSDCYRIVKECSLYDKGLPLGLITSPVLSNIYLKDFDKLLYKYLKRIDCDNIIYTRYADDIFISFKAYSTNYMDICFKCKYYVELFLKKYHLGLNENKTKFIDFNKSKQVRLAGVSIVEKKGLRRLSVGRNNKKKLFYMALDLKKNINRSKNDVLYIKGLLSYYLSIEKDGFDNFLSENMKKELKELNYNSIQELINSL